LVAGGFGHYDSTGRIGQGAAFLHLQGPFAAGFFSGSEYKDNPAVSLWFLGQVKGSYRHGRDTAFHIAGTSSPKASVLDFRAMRWAIPWGLAQGNGVQMPGENQRQSRSTPGYNGNKPSPVFAQSGIGDMESGVRQKSTEITGRGLFVSGRIDGIHANKGLGQFHWIGYAYHVPAPQRLFSPFTGC
jgi:hypothetical protein